MDSKNYNVIGIMSGTSLDGIDLARITFNIDGNNWSFKIHEVSTVPYSRQWVDTLKKAVDFTADELQRLNQDYTVLLSGIINDFMRRNDIRTIDALCSHGHTILHQPVKGITLQIGNLPEIAKLTGQKVVCDFRVQDVAMGGQGAPLVPIGDKILFPGYQYCLNLGGFSNISFDENGSRLAFDICPVNTVLNYYAVRLGKEYDDRGMLASQGNIHKGMLGELNSLEFYKLEHPKSLGFEFVKKVIMPLMEKYPAAIHDKLCTFTEHIALQVAATINKAGGGGKLLVTGGGAYNDFLIDRLMQLLPSTEVHIPVDKIIQYKEALIFALLGVLKLRGEVNVLASVTGAAKDHSSGNIFEP